MDNNDDLFALSSKQLAKRLLKVYEESKHPRDEKGRWSAGGVARTAALAGGGLVGAAALGVPGARHLLPGVRRSWLAAGHRAARWMTTEAAVMGRGARTPADVLRRQMAIARAPSGRYAKPHINLTRQQLNQFSAATRRRLERIARERRFV